MDYFKYFYKMAKNHQKGYFKPDQLIYFNMADGNCESLIKCGRPLVLKWTDLNAKRNKFASGEHADTEQVSWESINKRILPTIFCWISKVKKVKSTTIGPLM